MTPQDGLQLAAAIVLVAICIKVLLELGDKPRVRSWRGKGARRGR